MNERSRLRKPSLALLLRTFAMVLLIIGCMALQAAAQQIPKVKIWEEDLILPTYLVDPPEKAPMFFNHESYQGASKVIYPYLLEDDMTNIKEDQVYRAVYLENEYLKVCVLPEIGGRLFYATDKTNGYEMFYRQHVIKPAHIGMLGAWISGGIEFCVFHHHRATTNMPLDYLLEENEDGSATLWIGETERRHRMKWTFGISLYPGKSYLELDGRMINVTENTNSILYWANVATHVNEDYQVVFPPSTQFAVYHAKNSFSHWPITQEPYRGNSYYEQGVDASWWKNHPTANSFFAYDIQDGFLAGYDHGKEAGTMLVANPHIVKGAKLWEWGPDPQYAIWDTKVLTDNDGPYAELMSGAYSDNQPDYSWIKPYEQKVFKQYWYPIRSTGGATMANLHGLLNLQSLSKQNVRISANATTTYRDSKISLKEGDQTHFEKIIDISPTTPFDTVIDVSPGTIYNHLTLALTDASGALLLSYTPIQLNDNKPLPEPVQPPAQPSEISGQEDLYFTGLRIKQFYNARLDARDYFEEALKRDPLDTRCNTQMGITHSERGELNKAANYFRKALVRPTRDYTRPRNCEPLYHLGLILAQQGKWDTAYDTLYRAAWDYAFSSPAYFQLAQISTHRGDYKQALAELDRSLLTNAANLNSLNLKASLLRKLGHIELATAAVSEVLVHDKLNFWAHFERMLIDDFTNLASFKKLIRDEPESYLELAVGFCNAGLYEESERVLEIAVASNDKRIRDYPTIHYYLANLKSRRGMQEAAVGHWEAAQTLPIDYCFPFRMETLKMYEAALNHDPTASRAYYYQGNLLYDKQPQKAIEAWEQAVKYEPELAMAHRNLGWGYAQQEYGLKKAIAAYEKAIAVDPSHPRFYDELDRLYEENGSPIEKRYKVLTDNHQVVSQHNRPLVREALVANAIGDFDLAIDILTSYYFNRREGSGGLHDHYVDAHLLRGKKHLQQKAYKLALKDFEAADLYPENQSMGRDEDSQRRAQIFYLTGLAYEKMMNAEFAMQFYKKATGVEVKEPDYYYHQMLAYRKLGMEKEANQVLTKLSEAGKNLLGESADVDFFSKFGGNQFENVRKASGNYLLALQHLAKMETDKALHHFGEALALNPGHAWARSFHELSFPN
ncbi:MAG: DUF5107 domain-containing protein [Saprospiraceae bacterium]|nr:DUF5107 domain-containing protein [Saprospiraceae bacterium]